MSGGPFNFMQNAVKIQQYAEFSSFMQGVDAFLVQILYKKALDEYHC